MAAHMDMATEQLERYKGMIDSSLRDKSKPWTQAFDFAEEKTNISRLYLFLGAVAFCCIYLVFGYGAQLMCNIIGVLYPAYISIHAIESSSKEDDTRWLTYWVTFSIMSIIEYFSGVLTSVIPFYWLLKCIFLVWCMVPIEKNGSNVIYQQIVRPYFLKHHKAADKFLSDAADKAKSTIGSALKRD